MSDDVKQLLETEDLNTVRKQLSEQFESLSGSTLRKQVEDLNETVKTYKEKDRTRAFKDAGFDPESGPGKALAKLYEGEADPEAIKQFAKDEFGFEPPSADDGTGENGETPAAETQQQTGDERLAQVAQGSMPARAPSTLDELQKAQAEGRVDDAIRLNLQLQREANA